tara:strand:- start:4248 stop:6335 length:2088 start_codon:yes stop_codon:yes gene_type:complete
MADFILELLSEEIPSRMQKQAADYMRNFLELALKNVGLSYGNSDVYYSSRRLTLIVNKIDLKTKKIKNEKLGPRIDASITAIEGFLKSNNLSSIELCEIISDPKGDRYKLEEVILPKKTKDILPEIIRDLVDNFSWPKSMRWGNKRLRWVRPLRNVLAIIIDDNKIEKLKFDIEGLSATDSTFGHRFLKNKTIKIKSVSEYHRLLEDNFVIIDNKRRLQIILDQISKIEVENKINIIQDENLLNEVSGLVEWPVVLIGEFDKSFLDLPSEVLTTSMKSHQKYFSVTDNKNEKLTNKFVIVTNIPSSDNGRSIINGNQRVLSARLYDASYFWEKDLGIPLINHLEKLDKVTYHKKLGSVGDKIRRINNIGHLLSNSLNLNNESISNATSLMKNDLLTDMVSEFPELQGVMGRYYALNQGYDEDICNAIKEHYLPVTPADPTPRDPLSSCLSIADKLDSLICFWSIREKPTGSKDPYALRRAGNGLIRNIIENNISIDLDALIGKIMPNIAFCDTSDKGDIKNDLIVFLRDRMRNFIRDKNIDINLFNSVMNVQSNSNFSYVYSKLNILIDLKKEKKGQELIRSLKRVHNILEQSMIDKGQFKKEIEINENLLQKGEEKDLYKQAMKIKKSNISYDDINNLPIYLKLMTQISGPINSFFDNVIVNDENENIRVNRMNLLLLIASLNSNIFDIKLVDI